MKKIIWKILNSLKVGGPLQLYLNSQLKDIGWFNSFYKKESTDKHNKPLPWYTYPFISFLEPRLSKEMNVFEYGSGNSTIWFSERVSFITSVEHNKGWYDKVKKELPSNVSLVYKEIQNNCYANEVSSSGNKYDFIIIDGVDRNNCVYACINHLTPTGVIIYDNSQRDEYKESINFLISKGFKKLDFWGMTAITPVISCTSIFYKNGNCLEI